MSGTDEPTMRLYIPEEKKPECIKVTLFTFCHLSVITHIP
jgi:hypothetical protein